MNSEYEISPSVVRARETMRAPGEEARIREIDELGIRTTDPHPALDTIVEQVRALLDVPIASVTIVLEDEQWFKSYRGLPVDRTPRDVAFCTHVVATGEPLVVRDARTDPVFVNNPLVENPGVVAYAGTPIRTEGGHVVGTLCAIDHVARDFDEDDVALLEALAERVGAELEAIRSRARLDALIDEHDVYSETQFRRLARIEARRHHRQGIALAMAVLHRNDEHRAGGGSLGAFELTGWIQFKELIGIITPDGLADSLEARLRGHPHRVLTLEPGDNFDAWFDGITRSASSGT